ncbi:MAG TPA: tripartite tricarboxylate transporter substrate binding protein [Thermodesulfobacteriota bacterium]|nr:tripartite tricarboxylate transporter substrate binding protein [Thermodesulfobacteriota bacterium]
MEWRRFRLVGKGSRAFFLTVATLFLVCGTSAPRSVFAQEKYPVKPINFLIGFPAGGTTDVCARPLVNAASKILGQPIVVVNKPGGASAVAVATLKNEKPDGYTIGILGSGAVLSQHMRKVPYDTAKDFTPIMQYAVYLYGLVVQSESPWKTFNEFIEYARNNPGKIRYSTAGPGSPQHLVMERLALKEKIKWTHIPFPGGGPAVTALLGGHVEATSQTTEWKAHVESGRLRLLAVYGEKRMIDFPNVPTLLELGYDISAASLISIAGPKGISPQIVEILHGAFKKAMEDPDFVKASRQLDQPTVYRSPEDLGKHLVKMNEEVGGLVRSLGLREE